LDYVPTGEEGTPPSPEDDRDRNRLRIAARLIGVARAHGHSVDGEVSRLRAAEAALRQGDREKGRRIVEDVIGDLEKLTAGATPATEPTP